jgi:Transposase and inactivated derivatives
MQGKKDYQEKLFMSFQLSSRVPEDNFYRRLKSALNLDFLYSQTRNYYGKEGQKGIDPVVFFKLMLIGYIENINSDRKIVEQASMRMDMLYFLGYDIDESLPWHSTLSRTRQLYGEDLFLEVFRKVLGLCIAKGMVNGRSQAVDSAYIKSNASMESLVEKSLQEDSQKYFDLLSDNEEGIELPERNKRKRNTKKSNADFTSPTDPDARISKKKYKPLQLNYSGQISVDTSSHVICGAMADFADKKDSQSLPAIVGQTQENLYLANIKIEEVLADTNYSSGEALRYLEENNITGYIPNFGLYKDEHEGFTYFPEEDCYRCTQGVVLPFKGIRTRSDCDKQVKQYWSLKSDCKDCPLKSNCANKRGIKMIEDTIDKPYYERMYQRLQGNTGKRKRKVRSATVEPVLGTLLEFLGMRKVYTKGIELANKHVLMASTAYNLRKLMRFNGSDSVVQHMRNASRKLKQSVFMYYFSVTTILFYQQRMLLVEKDEF